MGIWESVLRYLAGGAVVAFLVWLLKLGLTKLMDLSLERTKNELQEQSQRQIEKLRAELTKAGDVTRHEMQRQMLRAQLSTTKSHEVYSELIKFLWKAEGAVGSLWGASWAPSYDKHSPEDIKAVLEGARTPGEEQKEILEQLASDRRNAIKRVKEVLRRRQIQDARDAVTAAKNHIILEGIFMTRPVRDLAFSAAEKLGAAWVQVEDGQHAPGTPGLFEKYEQHKKEAFDLIEELEEAMREDLLPGQIDRLAKLPV